MQADDIISRLRLTAHPEGGYYRETFRDAPVNRRSQSTAILYLLKAGEVSHWHRVDAVEIWHWHAGSPLRLSQSNDGKDVLDQILGSDLQAGQLPQIVVPFNAWQSAKSLGDWTLVGCTVSPGFEFDGFEMAPDGWEPGN